MPQVTERTTGPEAAIVIHVEVSLKTACLTSVVLPVLECASNKSFAAPERENVRASVGVESLLGTADCDHDRVPCALLAQNPF